MEKYLKKGSKILVDGRLQFSQYEDKDGTKKSNVDVIVDSFEFMDAKSQNREQSGNTPTPPPDMGFDPNDTPF